MTPLVLLPGMMCDARLFGPQIAAFSAKRAVHCAPIGAHDTMQALARDVLANAPPSFALAGLSMGGIVAMEVLAQAPERVTHLALLDTNPLAEVPDVQARRGPQMKAAENGRLREVMRDEMKPKYLIDNPDKPEILDLCMDMAMALGADVFIRQSHALRDRPDHQDTLRGVSVPSLILCGAEDQLCPLERHQLMHALIPGSRLSVIENAAHLPTLEQPDAVTDALVKWLED
jgi:pimeloyl-ACP methyl ester carboxylesterase